MSAIGLAKAEGRGVLAWAIDSQFALITRVFTQPVTLAATNSAKHGRLSPATKGVAASVANVMRIHGAGCERMIVEACGGMVCSVMSPDGQRTRSAFGGLPSWKPKKQAAVDWLM